VLAGGITGAYLASLYGPGVDPTYWWSRFATDTTIHLSAAVISTVVATILGLLSDIRAKARQRGEYKPFQAFKWPLTRPPTE
jgi:ABC-type transporter Mla maintaining outer membrane lipid asymmetry permease subunit MlaE